MMQYFIPKNCGILSKCTGGGSGCVQALNSTDMSAGLSAPRDNMAANAVRALRQDSPAVRAKVIGVTSWPLKIKAKLLVYALETRLI